MISEHKIHFPELPYYLSIYKQVDRENDNVKVVVRSRVHVNKEIVLPGQYSLDYVRDKQTCFLGDVFCKVIEIYGLKKEPTKYS